MSFSTGYLGDPKAIGSGEQKGLYNTILSAPAFEDNLVIGRFAKWDNDQLENMDNSATPVIAGVVMRSSTRAVEDDGLIDSEYYQKADYMREGLVTVDVVDGDTPAKFGVVYAHNDVAVPADYGKATTTSTNNVATTAEWIEEIDTNVWLIRLK